MDSEEPLAQIGVEEIATEYNPPRKLSGWINVLLISNFMLGLVLWFGESTNWQWSSELLNLVFPFLVGSIGTITFYVVVNTVIQRKKRSLRLLSTLPSILAGVLYILIIFSFIGLVGIMVRYSDYHDAEMIQQVDSPNGLQKAEVIWFTDGRSTVYVKPKYFPIIRLWVFDKETSYADEVPEEYLRWVDGRTLYIEEIHDDITFSLISFHTPTLVQGAYMSVGIVVKLIYEIIKSLVIS